MTEKRGAPDQKDVFSDLDIEVYNSITEQSRLEDIRLINLRYKVHADYYSAIFSPDLRDALTYEYKCEPKVSILENKDRFDFIGVFDWSVRVLHKKKVLLSVNADYMTIFANSPSNNEKAARFFVMRLGRNATYPYLRALVNFLSAESQAHIPVLPILTQPPVSPE